MPRIRSKDNSITAQIISAEDNKVVISVNTENKSFSVGQNLVATAPSTRKTALGRAVTDIVARGSVTKVEGKRVTIESKYAKPLISQATLEMVKKKNSPVNIREIKNISIF